MKVIFLVKSAHNAISRYIATCGIIPLGRQNVTYIASSRTGNDVVIVFVGSLEISPSNELE